MSEKIFPSDNQHYEKIGKTVKCIEDEIPFEIPESWEWCRLGSIGTFIRGSGIKRTETISEGIQCVRYGELYTTYTTSFEKTVSFVNEELANKSKPIQYGDALLTLTGENKQDIGKAVVFLGKERTVIGGDLIQYTNHCFEPLFLSYLLNSPYVVYQKSIASTGDIIVHLSGVKLSNILVAFPPIKEQARIVEAIDKYLPLVSKYDMYNISKSKMDSEIYPLLKKSLLQYAIQGKLVPQDPSDEPAAVLLERIRAEKEQLIKEGKIKRDKNDSYIYRGSDNSYYEKFVDGRVIDINVPFEIPKTWEWVRLKHIGEIIGGGTPSTNVSQYWDGEIPWLTPADMKNIHSKFIIAGERNITELGLNKSSAKLLEKYSILYSSRAPIGYIGIAQNSITTNQGFKSVSLYIKDMHMYLYYTLIQRTDDIKTRATGTTFKEISGTEFGNTLIPLPPIQEQYRIINYLEKMYNLL